MIQSSSSCVKLLYVLVLSRATRSMFWTLRSERCVRIRPNYGNRTLLSEWSDPKIRWSGAERSGAVSGRCRKTMERSGAGGRGAGTERGAEVTGLGWSVERLFRPLRSAPQRRRFYWPITNHLSIKTAKYFTMHFKRGSKLVVTVFFITSLSFDECWIQYCINSLIWYVLLKSYSCQHVDLSSTCRCLWFADGSLGCTVAVPICSSNGSK